MSGLKQLDELREYITADDKMSWDGHKTTWVRQDTLLIYLDAIEAEIAERFMELPVDADGEAIHIGDSLVSDEYDGKRFPCRGLNVEVCGGASDGRCA